MSVSFSLAALQALPNCASPQLYQQKLWELQKLERPWYKDSADLYTFRPGETSQLNIAEILWRILKGKWLQPRDYLISDTLFYVANRALE